MKTTNQVRIVCGLAPKFLSPMRLNAWSPMRSRMPSKPPALLSVNGSMSAKMPIVLMMNCTWSASVIDHMPPMTE